MLQVITENRDNPEFARIVETARLGNESDPNFEIQPTEAEAKALARLLGAQSVRKMRLAGRLTPIAGGGWLLEAELGATVVQTCVVSLEPVTTRIDQPVRRRFTATGPQTAEIVVQLDDEDDIEPLDDRIDLGLVAIEALALALPDYPRKPGALLDRRALAAEGAGPPQDGDAKPFAALAALRDKLGSGS